MTESQNPEHDEIKHTISRNVAVSILSKIFYLSTRVFIPPLVLKFVSLSDYGIWSYCFILLSYLGMGVFGITNVYIRYVAVYAAHGQIDKINRLLSTGIISVSIICLCIFPFLGYFLYKILPTVAFVLVFGASIIFMIDLTIGAFRYILQSLQKIVTERIISTIAYTTETLFIVIFLFSGFGIYSLLMAFFIRITLAITLFGMMCYRYLPGLSLNIRYFDKEMLPIFFHFGGIVQLSGLIGIANRSMERVVAGIFIGVEATGLFELGQKFPHMICTLPERINAAFLPATAHMHAKDMRILIVKLYLKGSRYMNIMTGTMMGFIATFSLPLITCWLGPDPKYQIAAVILSFFSVGLQMDVLTGPASSIYRSIEKPKKELIYGGTQLVLILMALSLGFLQFGFSIMVINICIVSMIIISALNYLSMTNRFLKIKQSLYWKIVIVPGIVPYGFGILLAWGSKDWFHSVADNRLNTLGYLLTMLTIYTPCVLSFEYFILAKSKERESVKKQLKHTLRELLGVRYGHET